MRIRPDDFVTPNQVRSFQPLVDEAISTLDRLGIDNDTLHVGLGRLFLTALVGVAFEDWMVPHRELAKAFPIGQRGSHETLQERVRTWKQTPEPVKKILRGLVYHCLLPHLSGMFIRPISQDDALAACGTAGEEKSRARRRRRHIVGSLPDTP
jgi:hypothetical protein